MRKIFNSARGFTLVEMLIYMGLLSILLVVMVDLFAASLDAQLESQAASSVDSDGRFILSRLSYDALRAEDLTAPVLGSTSASLRMVVGGATYTYSENNGILLLTNNNGTDSINGFDTIISNVSFKRLGNAGGKHSVRVSFVLSSRVSRPSGRESKAFQTTVGLR